MASVGQIKQVKVDVRQPEKPGDLGPDPHGIGRNIQSEQLSPSAMNAETEQVHTPTASELDELVVGRVRRKYCGQDLPSVPVVLGVVDAHVRALDFGDPATRLDVGQEADKTLVPPPALCRQNSPPGTIVVLGAHHVCGAATSLGRDAPRMATDFSDE